jgi:acyl-CoA dehydrogenase
MQELPWERMQIAIGAVAKAEAAISWTTDYVRERKAFGKAVASFQNTRFKLAELATEAQVARVFVDRCIELLLEKKLDTATASMAKYWTSDLENKIIDECLQLHGRLRLHVGVPDRPRLRRRARCAHLRRHQ